MPGQKWSAYKLFWKVTWDDINYLCLPSAIYFDKWEVATKLTFLQKIMKKLYKINLKDTEIEYSFANTIKDTSVKSI